MFFKKIITANFTPDWTNERVVIRSIIGSNSALTLLTYRQIDFMPELQCS